MLWLRRPLCQCPCLRRERHRDEDGSGDCRSPVLVQCWRGRDSVHRGACRPNLIRSAFFASSAVRQVPLHRYYQERRGSHETGCVQPCLRRMTLEAMLDRVVALGSKPVELRSGPNSSAEISAGHYPGQDHCKPGVLLADRAKMAVCARPSPAGLEISALSCHGNPVHPEQRRRSSSTAPSRTRSGLPPSCGTVRDRL